MLETHLVSPILARHPFRPPPLNIYCLLIFPLGLKTNKCILLIMGKSNKPTSALPSPANLRLPLRP